MENLGIRKTEKSSKEKISGKRIKKRKFFKTKNATVSPFIKKDEIIVNRDHISYSYQELTKFNISEFTHLQNLKYLNLRGNDLLELSEELFSTFPRLTWLDLRDNRLKTFPKTVVNHACLEVILIGGNRIKELPIELGSLPRLLCVQVTANPLVFPKRSILNQFKCDLVTFLKMCWDQQTTTPIEQNVEIKKRTKCTKKQQETGCLSPENRKPGYLSDENSFLVLKMKSNDPQERYEAEETLNELRNIDKELQKIKDRETLRQWRDKYKKGVAKPSLERFGEIPFGLDEDYLRMLNRDEANKIHPNQKKQTVRGRRKTIDVNEELEKLQKTLNSIRTRNESELNPAEQMARRAQEMKMILQIQKKIKALQLRN